MSKRNLIDEILAKKQREEFDYYGSFRLTSIESSFDRLSEKNAEDKTLLALYNVGIAACIEVAVRSTIRKLIDHGSPYIDRIEKFKNELRFELDIIKALHDKKISFGDFVSHLLPINGIEHINSHLDTLLDKKLRIALANVREFVEPPDEYFLWGNEEFCNDADLYLEYQKSKNESPLIIEDIDRLMNDINGLYKDRHITAHEANFESLTLEGFRNYLKSAECFIKALYEYVEQTLNPDAPRFPFGASILSLQASGEVFSSMENAYEKLKDYLINRPLEYNKGELEKLIAAQKAFENYFEKEEEFQLALYGNGLANSLRFLDARIGMTLNKPRAELLKDIVQGLNSED